MASLAHPEYLHCPLLAVEFITGPVLPDVLLPTGHVKIIEHTKTGEKEQGHLLVPRKVSMNWI